MKRVVFGMLALTMTVCQPAAAIEHHLVVRTETWDGEETYEVMAMEDYKKLEAEIKNEQRNIPKALNNATKRWTTDEQYSSYAKKGFPRAVAKGRQIRIMKDCPTADEASEKLDRYENPPEKKRDMKPQAPVQKSIKEVAREAERQGLMTAARQCFETELNALLQGAPAAGDGEKAAPEAAPVEEKKNAKQAGH